MLDLTKVHDVEVSDVRTWDAPDFSDGHISFATYDGVPMTDEQLEELNDKHRSFVYDKIIERLY